MKKYLNLALLSLTLLSSCGYKSNYKLPLVKKAGKDFTILQLTDIQIIDPTSQPYEGRISDAAAEKWMDVEKNAFRYVRELIERTKPNYIVLTGDNVYGQFDKYGKNFVSLVKLLESYKTPWSLVFGNHDGEYSTEDSSGHYYSDVGKGMEWQSEYLMNHTKYCLFDVGAEELGYGNYTVTVLQNKKPFYTFTMLDSHGCTGYGGGTINTDQIRFYASEMDYVQQYSETIVPNMMFFHIPIGQFLEATEQYNFVNGVGTITSDGSKNENGDYGENAEKFSTIYSGWLWNEMKERGNTKAIFCGHDHVNYSSIMYDGIRLTFGVKSSTYDYCDKVGGTVITIKDDQSFDVSPIFTELQ